MSSQKNIHMHPRSCLTAAGCLVQDGKVLLVKHKKLGIWLNPGGHIEPGELPHEAAEREFYEETGVFVEAYWTHINDITPITPEDASEVRDFFTPNPISTNLHWISEKNYLARLDAMDTAVSTTVTKNAPLTTDSEPEYQPAYQKEAQWQAGCEQHLNFLYLVRPLGTISLQQNHDETDGIEWFTLKELETLETKENIRAEVAHAMKVSADWQAVQA